MNRLVPPLNKGLENQPVFNAEKETIGICSQGLMRALVMAEIQDRRPCLVCGKVEKVVNSVTKTSGHLCRSRYRNSLGALVVLK